MIGAFSYNKKFCFFGQLKNTAYSIDIQSYNEQLNNHVGFPHRYLYLKIEKLWNIFPNLKYTN